MITILPYCFAVVLDILGILEYVNNLMGIVFFTITFTDFSELILLYQFVYSIIRYV